MVLTLGLFAIAFAVTLLVYGLRGRRVGDHPHCRRCGFDLFGAPPDATRCPECGADARGAPIGRRERRRWPIAIAAVLALVGAAGLAGVASNVQPRQWLPTWYVLREARSGTPASRVVPIDQLIARDAAAPLTANRRVALARAIVALQRDPANVWNPAWGDWVARRVVDQVLPADCVDAFFQNVLADCTVTFRPTMKQGGRATFQVEQSLKTGAPSASPSILAAWRSGEDRTLTIDGKAAAAPLGWSSGGVGLTQGGNGRSTGRESSSEWTTLAVGPHAVEYSSPIRVFLGPISDDRDRANATQLARVDLRWRGTITVLAKEDDSDVKLTSAPELAAAIRDAIQSPKIELPESKGYGTMLNLQAGAMPADIAFDVFVRQGDGPEQKLTTWQRKKSQSSGGYGFGAFGATLEPGVAELIFRASRDAARMTVDFTDIWDGEVRIANVPVTRREPFRPAVTPTTAAASE